MRVYFLNAEMTEAIVRRRAWWPLGRWLEAVVRFDPDATAVNSACDDPTCESGDDPTCESAWHKMKYANGDLVHDRVYRAIGRARRRAQRARPWRPARDRVTPAELVASRVDIGTGNLVRK